MPFYDRCRHHLHVSRIEVRRDVSARAGRILIHHGQHLRNEAHPSHGTDRHEGQSPTQECFSENDLSLDAQLLPVGSDLLHVHAILSHPTQTKRQRQRLQMSGDACQLPVHPLAPARSSILIVPSIDDRR